ncbi:aquaporin-like protein [Dendryphion nanum]|uniref:Aquaporin-like protein n=1 Tax=Dendryphion nanum TaxID=256645 RepID=A0A9P9IZB6_9PLEO|nr:aquaporin-like protein [Dendryphion nanum]
MSTPSEPPKTHDWAKDESPSRVHHEFAPPPSEHNDLTMFPTQTSAGSQKNSFESEKMSSHLRKTRSALGLHPDAPIDEDHDLEERQKLLWSRIRITLREPFAEFWGTLIMVMFGNGSVAQVLLSTGQTTAPGGNGFGQYQSISWGWGLGVMLGIYVAGDSGAYLNPAITFSNCLYRQLPWRRFPMYFVAQLLGGFVGSGIVYANYISAIDWFEGSNGVRTVPPAEKATAAIFCTYPQAFMTKTGQFFSEFIASTLLMFIIFALKDPSNNGVPKSDKWFPLCLFFLIFGLGACFGWETGYAINLARDFGPRLMSYAVGYPSEVWSAGGYYFWIPMVAPFLGCAFGGFLYDMFIYTGTSPVNTPWLGLKQILRPRYAVEARKKHRRREREEGVV